VYQNNELGNVGSAGRLIRVCADRGITNRCHRTWSFLMCSL